MCERNCQLTIADALKSPQFRTMEGENKKQTVDITLNYVAQCLAAAGVENNALATMITQNFIFSQKDMKIDEMIIILRDGIAGKYGKVYGHINLLTINEWIEKHNEQVAEHLENRHNRKKHEIDGKGERMNSREQTWKVVPGFIKPKQIT